MKYMYSPNTVRLLPLTPVEETRDRHFLISFCLNDAMIALTGY